MKWFSRKLVAVLLALQFAAPVQAFDLGGWGASGSGSLPRYVTDFYNGFELSGSTYSGGPTVVADNTGSLVTSPAGVLPIEGMRLSGSTWLPTTSLGAPIHASTPLRTRKGTVSVYDEGYKGPLIQPARTNLLLHSRDLSQEAWSKFATCTVTGTNQVNLPADGDRIYQSKSITNGEAISASGIYSGSGTVDLQLEVPGKAAKVVTITLTTTPTRYSVTETAAADGTAYAFMARRNIGRTATAAILDYTQLEIGSFSTSPIPTGATTVTRPAANLTRPTAGTALETGNNFAIYGRVVPKGVADLTYLFYTGLAFNPLFGVYAHTGTLRLRKRDDVIGDNIINSDITTPSNTPFEYLAYQHSVFGAGIRIRIDGDAWSVWKTLEGAAGTADATKQATYQIGARNNGNHFAANYPFTKIIRLNPNLHPQTQLADLLAKGRI